MKVHDCIRRVRKGKGMTQVHVAQELGISVKTYNSYELGKRELKADILGDIARVLDVNVSVFFEDRFFETENREHVTP